MKPILVIKTGRNYEIRQIHTTTNARKPDIRHIQWRNTKIPTRRKKNMSATTNAVIEHINNTRFNKHTKKCDCAFCKLDKKIV